MHGLPEPAGGLLGDMAEASFVVVPSFWAAGQIGAAGPHGSSRGNLDVRVLYPGWDGRPGLMQESGSGRAKPEGNLPVRIASSSNWIRAKGMVEAAWTLGLLSQNATCPPWLWQAAGTLDPVLIAEARSGLGRLAGRLEPLGHLDPDALVRLLHGSGIFLHPSGRETFCLSVFEAVLAGCRIVARAIGGVPEAVQLAQLLRSQLELPPVGVHLAPPALHPVLPLVQPGPAATDTAARGLNSACLEMDTAGGTDLLGKALEAALAEEADQARPGSTEPALVSSGQARHTAASSKAGTFELAGRPASALSVSDLLREFSWQGRLEKLLLGQSDRPLPPIIQPHQTEAS
jgi:hypothetical protein